MPGSQKFIKDIGSYIKPGISESADNFLIGLTDNARIAYAQLIVLLATRGTVKETTANTLAKFGRGRRIGGEIYEYSTTLGLPRSSGNRGLGGNGETRRPHMRRGHVRRQHYGPGGQYIKKVFVEACFVNFEEGVTADLRSHYNVS